MKKPPADFPAGAARRPDASSSVSAIGAGFGARSRQCLVAAVEVGRSPTGSFELKARGGELLDQRVLTALRALRQRLVAHLLKEILLKAAARAFVSVDRHGVRIRINEENRPEIIRKTSEDWRDEE